MKIFILGLPKSGTSILAYRIYHALRDPKKIYFEPSSFGQNLGEDENIHHEICRGPEENCVSKCLIFPQFQPNWELAIQCSRHYDKKIWIARDPRDRIVSEYLYSFFVGAKPEQEPARTKWNDNLCTALKLLERKEKDPQCLPFHRVIVHYGLIQWQQDVYRNLCSNVDKIDNDWFILRYEDFVEGNVGRLNDYLEFDIKEDAEVPDDLQRVARTKTHGNWRSWFTREDQDFFSPHYSEYMTKMGYDVTDWQLENASLISDGSGSAYIKKLIDSA